MDNLCNVTTGRARFSYVHLYKPYAHQPGQEEKYQVTVLVPKSDVDTKARSRKAFLKNGTESARRSFRLLSMMETE